MTRKEKVAQVEPMAIDDDFKGGVWGCPSEYPFFRAGRCGSRELHSGNVWKIKEVRL